MVVKKCIICNKEFDAKGSSKTCSKSCGKEYKKQYNQQYYQDNKEHMQQYQKKYYQDNKEHVLRRTRQYYQDNKEHYRQYHKQYHQDNKEHILQQKKQYYQDNKEHIQQRGKQYYQDNKEYIQQQKKQYRQDNGDYYQQYNAQYKKEEVDKLIKQYNGDLDKILEKVPTPWHLREAQMQVWFNESYFDGIIAKIESTPCCEVTGKKDNLVVHHLYSFNTHPILGNDPSNMVRINKKVHDDFHKQYGFGNNTPEQWEQFVEDYNKSVITLDDFKD